MRGKNNYPHSVIAALIVANLVIGVCAVDAFVLENKTPAQKLRKDISKQNGKYIQCIVKAALKCEAKGGNSGSECLLGTGEVTYAGDADLDPKNKQPDRFQAAVAKCDEKQSFSKKGTDYDGIGCPGDCDLVADGVQRCADLATYEALTEGTEAPAVTKVIVPVLALAVDATCAIDTGDAANSTNPLQIECVANNSDTLVRYVKGLSKCQDKCENDYKGKKGGGGDNDLPNCNVADPAADPDFQTCADKALAKAEKKNALSATVKAVVLPQIDVAQNDANNNGYNPSDPVIPGGNPCSTCGNATREGIEECDGSDDALCPGSCNSDCTCP